MPKTATPPAKPLVLLKGLKGHLAELWTGERINETKLQDITCRYVPEDVQDGFVADVLDMIDDLRSQGCPFSVIKQEVEEAIESADDDERDNP